jgi:MFS family permease
LGSPAGLPWRIVALASLGGALEQYDFYVYGVFAVYISRAFFPAANPLVGLLRAFAVLAVGNLGRPLGGIFFGHIGDRFGRRAAFLASLIVMSSSTIVMAALPTYASWGVWATGMFVLLRFVQGLCFGGELPGIITYIVESAPTCPGLALGLGASCIVCGVLVATLMSLILHATLSAADVQIYGWRVAFGFGGLFGIASYFLRSALEESPAYALIQRLQIRVPFFELVRRYPWRVVVGFGLTAPLGAFTGLLFIHAPSYLVLMLHHDGKTVAVAQNLAIGMMALWCIVSGFASNRLHPRLIHRLAVALLAIDGLILYWAMSQHRIGPVVGLSALSMAGGLMTPMVGVLLAWLFPTGVRFSGIAFAYNLSMTVFAGFGPLFVTALITGTGNALMAGFFLSAVAGVSLLSGLFSRTLF